MEQQKKTEGKRALHNWQKVKHLLLKKSTPPSKLLPSLPLTKTTLSCTETQQLIEYSHPPFTFKAYQAHHIPLHLSTLSLTNKHKVDGTGQWVWQAQLILAAELFKNYQSLRPKSVLELGAGSSGYAAMAAMVMWQPEVEVVITDGKEENLETVRRSVEVNGWEGGGKVRVEELLWGETEVKGKYGLLLAADCLFFEKYHDGLIATLKQAMHAESVVLMVCPSRGKSMERFLEKATKQGLTSKIRALQPCKDHPEDHDRNTFYLLQLHLTP